MPRIKWSFRKTHEGALPIRQTCDPLNPRQALLWMFTGFALRGAPIPLPVEYWEELSEHIVECLGVPVEETGRGAGKQRRLLEPIGASLGWEPRRKYQPPTTVMNRATAAGAWVTIDEPDPETESVREVLARLSTADRSAIKNAVLDEMGLSEAEPEQLLPDRIPISRVAEHLNLKPSQVVTLLESWGVTGMKPRSWVDRNTALRVVTHYRRAAS